MISGDKLCNILFMSVAGTSWTVTDLSLEESFSNNEK